MRHWKFKWPKRFVHGNGTRHTKYLGQGPESQIPTFLFKKKFRG